MKGFTDNPGPGVSFSRDARPSIYPNHVDGPLLTFRDGQMHWLTLGERLLFALGLVTAESLEKKLRPNLMWLLEHKREEAIRRTESGMGRGT